METVRSLTEGGKAHIEEVCQTIIGEWNTKTGRQVTWRALAALYHNNKRRQARGGANGIEKRELAPGSVVVVVETGSRFAKVHPNLEAALVEVNGNVNNFEFFEARKLTVRYKTVLVIE
jgi:hypothetical protein